MPQLHHIQSATEQYNDLADWIVECWKETFPDLNSDYYNVHYMINMLQSEAKQGIKLRNDLVQQAQDRVNDDFTFMRNTLALLDNSGKE